MGTKTRFISLLIILSLTAGFMVNAAKAQSESQTEQGDSSLLLRPRIQTTTNKPCPIKPLTEPQIPKSIELELKPALRPINLEEQQTQQAIQMPKLEVQRPTQEKPQTAQKQPQPQTKQAESMLESIQTVTESVVEKIQTIIPETQESVQKQVVSKPAVKMNKNTRSLSDYTAYVEKSYDEVFISTVAALEKSPFTIASYDSESGRIFCNYKKLKPIYIIVMPLNKQTMVVRLTPADGEYNIPPEMVKVIFNDIKASLDNQSVATKQSEPQPQS